MVEKPGDVGMGTEDTSKGDVSGVQAMSECEKLASARSAGNGLGVIRSKIECTEAEMAGTLDAIQKKLSFDYLRKQAEERLLDMAEGRARAMMERAGRTSGELGHSIVDMVKENPVPMALLGAGLGLLVISAVRSPNVVGAGSQTPYYGQGGALPEDLYQSGLEEPGVSDYMQGGPLDPEGAGHRALNKIRGLVTSGGREAQSSVAEYARQYSTGKGDSHRFQKARQKIANLNSGNLLAVGLGALALGAIAGLMLPRTGPKRGVLDSARESLVTKTREYGQRAVHAAEKVADTARRAAREEIERQSSSSEAQSYGSESS